MGGPTRSARATSGPYATLAIAAGAELLAALLYIDAVVSPAGTGLVYVATSSRLSYALGREGELLGILARLRPRGSRCRRSSWRSSSV